MAANTTTGDTTAADPSRIPESGPEAGPETAGTTGPDRPAGRWPWWVAAIGALVSGLLIAGSFPRYSLLPDFPTWWLAPLGVALLALTLRGQRPRRGAWLGFLHGLALFGPPLEWSGTFVGSVWLFIPLSQAAFMALAGAWHPLLWRLRGRWVIAFAPLVGGLWVLIEGLRGRVPFGGFPWAKLAFGQEDSPALKYASLGGSPLVTFVVAVAGGLVALTIVALFSGQYDGTGESPLRRTVSEIGTGWTKRRLVAAVVPVALAIVLLGAGAFIPIPAPDGPKVNLAVIQGNVPRSGLDFNAQRRAVLDNHVRATMSLAAKVAAGTAPRPDAVIWPENSSDISPLENPDAAEQITRAARAIGAPILTGTLTGTGKGNDLYNLGLVWDPKTGPGQRYAKNHPLPFAEYLPLREFLLPIARFFSSDADRIGTFVAGTTPGVLKVGPVTLGDVICFEVAFDAETRASMDNGRAQLVAVQTNNATFGRTAESAQQMAMVRLRAVEYGRPALMASTTGSSAFIRYDGTIEQSTELYTQRVLTQTVQLGAESNPTVTLAARLGQLPEWVLALLTIATLIGITALGRRRSGQSGGSETDAAGAEMAESGTTDRTTAKG